MFSTGYLFPAYVCIVRFLLLPNETKNVTLPVNEAYGPVNPKLIRSVPLKAFGNQSVHPGMHVTESSTGQPGVVTAVNATNATVDFNSPLAGQILLFTIKVIQIQRGHHQAREDPDLPLQI